MATMVAEVYRALREAGVSDASAEAAASSVAVGAELATKADIAGLRSEMLDRLAKVERQQALLLYGYGPVTIGLLVKLAFFPS